jgi:hypothetical protein
MSKLVATEIRPALAPEEWARRRSGPISVHHMADGDALVITHGKDTSIRSTEELCALMALANDALPDGEPRKITRAWVTRIQTMSDLIADLAQRAPSSEFLRHEAHLWSEMAQGLEALLPPI